MSNINTFEDLNLSKWIVKQLKLVGLKKPTPVQVECIPAILRGEDCLGCAKTGSGKTAAFALPILQRWAEDPYGIFALVLSPTRELAHQISEQFTILGKPLNLRVITITGGLDQVQQGIDLSVQPHIVVSTPGRLVDHIRTHPDGFSLARIKFLVVDEADRLLEGDFVPQLENIFEVLPKRRQTLLFSATMTDTLEQLQTITQRKPFVYVAPTVVATVESLDQRYVLCPAAVKDAYLFHVLDKFRDSAPHSSIIIFTNTCKLVVLYCQILCLMCHELGFPAAPLHAVLKQKQRLASLNRFKSNQVRLLIATDVASRGLDLPMVDLIINHNVPTRAKDYVHRVGRTARAGRCGTAITMVTQFDINLTKAIEEHIQCKMSEHPTNDHEVTKIATEVAVSKREAELLLDEQDFGENKEVYRRKRAILEGRDPDEPRKSDTRGDKRKNFNKFLNKRKSTKHRRNSSLTKTKK